jgi:hypothetical protein
MGFHVFSGSEWVVGTHSHGDAFRRAVNGRIQNNKVKKKEKKEKDQGA